VVDRRPFESGRALLGRDSVALSRSDFWSFGSLRFGLAFAVSLLLPCPAVFAGDLNIKLPSVTSTLSTIAQDTPGQLAGDVSLATRNRNLFELGQELSRIYLTLYNSKRLSLRTVESTERSTEAVLRKQGLFYGSSFTNEIDSMLCDLNSDICTRERVEATLEQLKSPTSNLLGLLPSKANWKLDLATNNFWVPDVALTKNIEWFPYDMSSSKPLAAVVVDELGGCQKFDQDCQKLIEFYNPSLVKKTSDSISKARLILPVLTLKVSTNVADATEVKRTDASTLRSHSLELQKIETAGSRDNSWKVITNDVSSKSVAISSPTANLDQVVKQLQHNILPKISIDRFDVAAGSAVFPTDVLQARTELNRLLSWPPQLSQVPYPPEFRGSVGVGVMDSRVDDQHCGLDYSKVTVLNHSAPPNLGARANCDLAVTAVEDVDHGTHVVGIIEAFFPQGGSRVPIGLNPYAQVTAMEIDFIHPSSDQIANDMTRLVQERLLKVVNMSFGYLMTAQNPDLQLTDPLEAPISALVNATLFVAAAGNAGINKSYLCDIRPACFDLPNVIAVAALNRNFNEPSFLDSDQRSHSNYGNRIHVAAIGESIFSTIANGRFGVLSGTSQAAPQVSAIASLMFAKYGGATPLEVKNRLIYCSDMIQSLEEKVFSGGRVNADCALDGDSGRLIFKIGGALHKGKLDLRETLTLKDSDDAVVKIGIRDLRALEYNSWSDTYTVFYNPRGTIDSTLLRISGLKFSDPTQSISFTPVNGHAGPVIVSQIGQFVSSMK